MQFKEQFNRMGVECPGDGHKTHRHWTIGERAQNRFTDSNTTQVANSNQNGLDLYSLIFHFSTSLLNTFP